MKLDIPADLYAQIAAQITSDDSPVGIDAKKTHIIIIDKLLAIERRLERLEQRLDDAGASRPRNAE